MLLFTTGHLLHRRSMMMMTSLQYRLIWILQKSPVPSILPSFKLPCLHQNYFPLLALTACRLLLHESKSSKTTFQTESSFRNINPPSDTHTANKILTNTILNADKHNIPMGKSHHNCKLLPEDIRTRINTRNNIRKHNPLDPNLAKINN